MAACAEQPKRTRLRQNAPPAVRRPRHRRAPEPERQGGAVAKAGAQAVDQLQNGDEIAARQTLGKALGLDPANDIAKKMNEQIAADAQKELGATFFRYTVARDDSLSKLAQQYLGDRFRFYILAKYNDIANPSRLAAGQVIKIPGRAPPPGAAPPRAATPGGDATDGAVKASPAEAAPPVNSDLAALMQKGRQQQTSGDREGAYATFSDAVARYPGNRDAVQQRDAAKAALIG
jgi:LysM repeat protein